MLLALAALSSLAAPSAAPRPSTYDPSRSLAPMVRAVSDAVVKIEIHGRRTAPTATQILHQGPTPRIGEGSGFVVSADGLVLTNHHVVAGAEEIQLEFADGTTRHATLVGSDLSIDVALLKVDPAPSLTWITFGDSDAIEVGDWVVAMGNGLGLGTTVTAGIVSAKGRVLSQDALSREDFIQTDAAINQGNSGGPLFNLDGAVIGMSAAVITGANTVGFAIPSNVLTDVIADLRTNGRVVRGFLGVQPQPLDDELREARGIVARTGAMVATVYEGTPAASAGLREGDVVLSVDGDPIDSDRALVTSIGLRRPGDKVRLEVERDTELRTVCVVLGEQAQP
jgi:serine protease Do